MLNSVYCHNCRTFLRVPGSAYCSLHNDKSTSLRKNYVPILESPVDFAQMIQYTRTMDKNTLIEKIETKILEFEESREGLVDLDSSPLTDTLDTILALAEYEEIGDVIKGLQLALDIVKDQS